jgi:hypothetical protein
MKRVYLRKGQRVSKAPKGGSTHYGVGHHNVEDSLADTWIRSGDAFLVDANDEPIKGTSKAAMFDWHREHEKLYPEIRLSEKAEED